MVNQTWLPHAVAVTVRDADTLSISAQLADDRTRLRLLAVNNQSVPIVAAIQIKGWLPIAASGGTTGVRSVEMRSLHVNITTLSASSLDADNPPGNPTLISPKTSVVQPSSSAVVESDHDGGSSGTVSETWSYNGTNAHSFPPLSVSTIVLAVGDDDDVRGME